MSFHWVLDWIEIWGLWRSSQHLKLLVLLLKPLLNHVYFVTGSIILLNIFVHWSSSLWGQELVFWLCLQKKHVKCLNVKLEQPLFTRALKKVAFCPPTHTTAFWFMLFEVDHLNVLGNDISACVINSSSFLKKAFVLVSTLPSSQWELGGLSSGCEGVYLLHIYIISLALSLPRGG